MRAPWFASMIVIGLVTLAGAGLADISIYDIQSNTSDGDASVYDGQIADVAGGIVTHKWSGFRDRVYLMDPAHPTWGAICVKDSVGDLLSSVNVGDWVSFDQVLIEEYRGTTYLQYNTEDAPNVAFNVDSTGNEVPSPMVVTAADLVEPVNHTASEPYESMIVTLEDVTVGQIDLGKAGDNYELLQGGDVAWGSDYMNVDAGGPYHPSIYPGAELTSITGVVEQYTKLTSGWDYYQLLTRSSADIVPEPGMLMLVIAGVVFAARRR